jgi:hypothetical protein
MEENYTGLRADNSELEQKNKRIEELGRKQTQFELAFQSLIDSGIVKPYIEFCGRFHEQISWITGYFPIL